MAATAKQQAVINAALDPSIPLITTQACAGSGKTYTLVEIAKAMVPTTGLYLAYNKAIAEEASDKFKGTNINCSTIHAIAYQAVVRQYGFKVGYFKANNVAGTRLSYSVRNNVVRTLEDFFLSMYTDINQYFEDMEIDEDVQTICINNLNLMSTGKMVCPHSFYLKIYHIYLADGTIPTPEVDLLMMDEAGDVTALTLDIFKLIKAKKKIAVGDPMQNIYSFNKTINAFHALPEAHSANLTESFRVSRAIASRIERFVNRHLDPSFEFTGRDYPANTPITTTAYIARNNSGLLEEMFRLKKEEIPFHTTRKIAVLLELPLILANLGNGKKVEGYQYKHIENLRSAWETSPLIKAKYKTVNEYVRRILVDDDDISRALDTVFAHGPRELNSLAKYAKECAKVACTHTLTTAHSSKGLEFSAVEISPDLNHSTYKAILGLKREEQSPSWNHEDMVNKLEEELRLYYVACSRSMVVLANAEYLPEDEESPGYGYK